MKTRKHLSAPFALHIFTSFEVTKNFLYMYIWNNLLFFISVFLTKFYILICTYAKDAHSTFYSVGISKDVEHILTTYEIIADFGLLTFMWVYMIQLAKRLTKTIDMVEFVQPLIC